MVLRPLDFSPETASTTRTGSNPGEWISPWAAVERKQKQQAEEWFLIAQPDHAALAGDVAALLDSPLLPTLDAQVVQAIALHDSGWALFDGGERGTGRELEVSLKDPQVDRNGRPLSFLEVKTPEFLVAWRESIRRAAQTSDTAGILVSEHFCRIARFGLENRVNTAEEVAGVQHFLSEEADRQKHLRGQVSWSAEELRVLVDVLQFCDLLSLYLCCGSREDVEFPQRFSGKAVRASWPGDALRIEPTLIRDGASLGITARRYPNFGTAEVSTIGFLIQ